MRLGLLTCAVIASLSLLQSAAQADRPFKIGFGGGVSVPVSDAKDAFKNGAHGQAMIMFAGQKLPIGLRATVGYERLSLKSLAPGLDGNGRILSGLANVTLGIAAGPVKPYLLAGLGAFNLQAAVSGTSNPSQTKFGIDAGAGVEFRLGGILGFIEGRLENIYTDQGFSSSVGSARAFSTRIIPVTFGVFF